MDFEGKYDNILLSILTNEEQIIPFFDVFFDFLFRRTDFFKIRHGNEGFGFPPHAAEEIVKRSFQKYYARAIKQDQLFIEKMKASSSASEIVNDLSDVIKEVEVTTTEEEVIANEEVVVNEDPVVHDEKNFQPKKDISEMVHTDFQSLPESYNGAIRKNYCWSQTINDLEARIFVPGSVKNGKQVQVNIEQGHLKTRIFDNGEWNTVVDDDLRHKVKVDDSLWSLVPGEHVLINFEKTEHRFWESLLKSEESINLQSIDASLPFSDLDQESKTKFEEIAYKEHLKKLGKATPDEMAFNNVLKEAWEKEGSPFKGHPFDPSILNFTNPDSLRQNISNVQPST